MRLSRTATVVGAALLIGGLGVTAASAAGALSDTVIDPAGENITVTWSGLTNPPGTNAVLFIQQCYRTGTDPLFTTSGSCSGAVGENPPISAGTQSFDVFGGDDPNGFPWGCGPNTTPGFTKGSVSGTDTCWIRLAPGSTSNVDGDEFLPFTFGSTPPAEVPEVPLNVLLPASAAAVLGAGILVARKRQVRRA
jgi:hypothetical protein